MLGFVLGVTVVTGIVFGIVPALRATGMNVSATLKESSRSVAGSRSRLGRSLLVMQVAVSLVLLIAAGLFLRTLQNLRNVDVGFNTRNLVVFNVRPALNGYDEPRGLALYDRMIEALGGIAGVRSVAASNVLLLSNSVNSTSIFVQGRTYAPDRHDSINRLVMTPAFFETMEMPIRAGRGLTARDDMAAPKVAVINETAARTYFPNENPVGQHIGSSIETAGQIEVVGIVRDAKYDSVRDAVPPTMYVPFRQQLRTGNAVFHVRTAGDPSGTIRAVRDTMRQIDATLPLTSMTTQMEQVEKRLGQEKVFAQAYTLFGALALLIASIGLFGLMSYSVARRTNEIGIRMALGAQPQDVLRLVMRESMILVIVGIAIGLGASIAASRLVTTLLYGLAPTDPATMVGATTVLVIVSALAGYLPARRAARVDPLIALHYE